MIKAHNIKLKPTAAPEAYFYRVSGVACFAWNWALDEYKRRKAAHKLTGAVRKRFSMVCVEDPCQKELVEIAGKSTRDAGIDRAI